jgi:hypothetical protein
MPFDLFNRTPLSRRSLIQAGAIGSLGLTLPKLLASQGIGQTDKSCIFIVLSGGLSHIDTLDPKPLAPRETRGPYDQIATAIPGIQFTEMMPRLAQIADRFSLVRSLSHRDTVHVSAAHTMLTGQPNGTKADDSPFMGSLISRFQPGASAMPSYVWLHNMKTGTNKVPRYNNGLHKIGHEHAPLRIGYELDNPSSETFHVSHFDPPEGVSPVRLDHRFELLRSLEEQERNDRWQQFHDRARDLISGPRARNAFDLSQEAESVRDRYGRNPLGQYLLMARRLIEAGVRLVTVTGWPGLAPGETEPTVTQVWDMHDSYYSGDDNMYGNGPYGMKWAAPRLDRALTALITDLEERGLLDTTFVPVLGEFGRSPKFEGQGRGRGHWPNAYTGLFAGGGVKRGFVYGSSDKVGGEVASGRPVSHVDMGATIFRALDIPLETRYGADGFSFRVNNGQPLEELFG